MKVLVLYHPRSEQKGQVTDLARDYERFKAKKLELISLETRRGADYARLYGTTQYPAFLAIAENGSLLRLWQGSPLPLMDELDYYTRDQENHDYTKAANHSLHTVQPPTT
ncbi:hypothetical protein HYS42_00120 [Candidatus Saccharibacteria bacterium]|nr:hypothetical protein [Candidatus Saccharibacteria bacterium]